MRNYDYFRLNFEWIAFCSTAVQYPQADATIESVTNDFRRMKILDTRGFIQRLKQPMNPNGYALAGGRRRC